MKTCTICKEPKEDNEFSFKDKKNNKRHSQCKTCKKIIDNTYYKDSSKRRSKVRKDATKGVERARTFVRRIKKLSKCSKCNESRWYVLDFHHIHNKIDSVSKLANSGRALNTIKKEIKKCIVLCSNCHREEHFING